MIYKIEPADAYALNYKARLIAGLTVEATTEREALSKARLAPVCDTLWGGVFNPGGRVEDWLPKKGEPAPRLLSHGAWFKATPLS